MLDRDLAELYDVQTKVLKQAVRRNIKRFPADFMFELGKDEFENLRSQIVTSSWGGLRPESYSHAKPPSPQRITHANFSSASWRLGERDVFAVRYQLLHRTASALIEANGFNAKTALMLVHFFSEFNERFDVFKAFVGLSNRHCARLEEIRLV